jgi:iron transport multicopper oxidase
VCELSAAACGALCQSAYSAPMAPCQSKLPMPPPPASLPRVPIGSVCGEYVAACETGCCNRLNYCEPDTGFSCSLSSCELAASPNSAACQGVHSARQPAIRRYKLVATWGKVAPDGFETSAVLVNGQFPSPTIYANSGDRIIVEYVNKLGIPTTLHWHGMKQVTTNIMDGVEPVTQVGTPGNITGFNATTPPPVFLYDFIADAPGAYWYHDHGSALAYVDGLRGALIVSERSSRTLRNYANRPTIFFADQYHEPATNLLTQYISPDNSAGVEPVPASFWINGLAGVPTPWCGGTGQQPCRSSVINAGPVASCNAPNTVLNFVSGAAFGFVLINLEGAALRARVVVLDGIVLPTPFATFTSATDSLVLYPGQRASVELCSSDPVASAAKPAKILLFSPLDQYGQQGVDTNGLGLTSPPNIVNVAAAILDLNQPYKDTDVYGSTPSLNSTRLVDRDGAHRGPRGALAASKMRGIAKNNSFGLAPPPPASKSVPILLSTGQVTSTSAQYFFFNNITLSLPPQPATLDSALTTGLPPNAAPNTAGYHVLDFNYGDVVDLVFYNSDPGVHPLHLHGQSFWIMAQGQAGDGPYDPNLTPLAPLVARDVAAVQADSYLVLRFQSSHPLLWFFHCHIEWHLGKSYFRRGRERGRGVR